jgi:type I restriction enzyme, S subunit
MKNGWRTKRLGDVLEVQNGYAFDSAGFNPQKGLPLIRIRSLKPGTENETRFDGDYDKKYVVKAGDLLIGMDGEFGCYEWKGEPALLNQRVCRLLGFSGELVPRFLFYGVNDYLKAIEDVTGFATVKHLSSKQILAIEFPIPPLPEQKRIVGLLDKAFEGIATAQANAEKNLQNARALFESQLQSVFTQRAPGWVERRLGDVFDIGSSKRIRETEWTSSGVPFYGGKEVVRLAKFGTTTSDAYISEEKFRDYSSKYDMPRKGDILITARGTIGVGYIVKEGDKFYYKDGNIISFREKTPTNPHFILYAFRSEPLVKQFADLQGATVKHLPIERAKDLILKMPSFATQNSVVEHLKGMEAETQRLASIYEQKLAALAALKQSLLHQAFTGAL